MDQLYKRFSTGHPSVSVARCDRDGPASSGEDTPRETRVPDRTGDLLGPQPPTARSAVASPGWTGCRLPLLS